MLYDFQQCLLTNECILVCLYFSLFCSHYFYVRRTHIHTWHVSFDHLIKITSGDSSKLLHLAKYFQVWIDYFIKGRCGSCRSVPLCSRFCLFLSTKTRKLYLRSRMKFYRHTYQCTCDPDQDSEHLWASESSIVPLSCQKPCRGDCCSDLYSHRLVFPEN